MQEFESSLIYDTKVFRSTFAALQIEKPYVIQQGGTSSGKTFSILLAIFQFALQSKKRLTISVVAATLPMLKKGAIKDFETILSMANYTAKQNKTNNYYVVGLSKIEFFAVDSSGKAKSGKRDILFINEANEVEWDIVYQLTLRSYGCKIFDYNPSAEFWLHDEFFPKREERDFLFKRTTYKDNPSLSKETIREIESLPPDLFRIYGEGRLGQIKGLVFENWSEIESVPPEAKLLGYGLDYGFTNDPSALVAIYQFDNCLIANELFCERGMTTNDIHERFIELKISRYDKINADSSEPRLNAELYGKGWNIEGVAKGADSVRAGLMKLKTYKILVTKRSHTLKKELKSYKWQERNGVSINIPIDKFNHAIDALRYGAINLRDNVSDLLAQ